jgi:hypothetical protein
LRQVGGFLRPPVSFTNKTDSHDITEILLKVALNTITLTPQEWSLVVPYKAKFYELIHDIIWFIYGI